MAIACNHVFFFGGDGAPQKTIGKGARSFLPNLMGGALNEIDNALRF